MGVKVAVGKGVGVGKTEGVGVWVTIGVGVPVTAEDVGVASMVDSLGEFSKVVGWSTAMAIQENL